MRPGCAFVLVLVSHADSPIRPSGKRRLGERMTAVDDDGPQDTAEHPGGKMASHERLLSSDPSLVDLQAPTRTQRISVDVDVAAAHMTADQVCGLLISALEDAYPFVRGVRINQCSSLTQDGMNGFQR